jgi:FkbM family methyltransferase
MMDILERINELVGHLNAPVVLEIGGHNGASTLNIIKQFKNQPEYHIFEPDIRIFNSMQNRVPNFVKTVNKAISGKSGTADFYLSGGGYSGSSSLRKPTKRLFNLWPNMTFQNSQIEAISLDDYCCQNRIEFIDFIWADVQGAEKDMIEGGQMTLKVTKYLYTEYNSSEIYEGCLNKAGICEMLPDWDVIEDYGGDILLENKTILL